MNHEQSREIAAAPPQRRGARSVEWTLIIAICFSIVSLLKLEPLARNSVSVQNHISEFDLPQTKNHSVGTQTFQSSETLSSNISDNAAPAAAAAAAAVERVGSKQIEEGGESASSSRNEEICTFCKGGILNEDLIVPRAGGNTCGSIKTISAGHLNESDICEVIQKEERVCCPGPPPAKQYADVQVIEPIMETLKKNLLPCEMKSSQPLHRRCSSFDNITNTSTHLFIYNPSIRDKFLCNANLIIGPKSMKPLTYDDIINKCGGGKDLMLEIAFRSHSFPQPPTMENRHQFPGILIENREKGGIRTKQLVDSLRLQLSTTRNAPRSSKKLMGVNLDDTFSSNAVASKEKSHRPPKMYGYYLDDSFSSEEDTVFSDAQCDIKCAAEPSPGGIVFQQYVYGTDWLFTFSIEGEVCANHSSSGLFLQVLLLTRALIHITSKKNLPVKVDENAWKRSVSSQGVYPSIFFQCNNVFSSI